MNIIKYKSDESIKYLYKSKYPNKSQKYINLYEYHFSYKTDIDKLAKLYICNNCAAKFRDNKNLTQHNNTCKFSTILTFDYKDKIWIKPRNIIIKICDYYNVPNIDFKYDYLVTFDRESILLKTPIHQLTRIN